MWISAEKTPTARILAKIESNARAPQRARRHNARTPNPQTGKFLFGFPKNRLQFFAENQRATD